jgi:FkbM family methyltransferase
LDLGANYGQFSAAIVERFKCKCVAVEPSPEPFAAIQCNSQISKLQLAVSDRNGQCDFHVAPDSTASSMMQRDAASIETVTVRTTTLADLLEQLGWDRVDLVKVDIEGAEIPMLNACPDDALRRIGQLSVEFHDFNGVTPSRDVEATLNRLRDIGFQSVRMSRVGHQDTWIVNQKLLGISTAEILFTRWLVRNWFGAKRVLGRRFRRVSASV